MELPVYLEDGEESGRSVRLGGAFTVTPNDHVVWLDVRRLQASRHQGTHKTKERGEVRGSTRKLYRQKGTGMSRSGSITSPLRRSGGRTFGPRPRKYSLRLSKKTRRLARASAMSYKVSDEKLRVVEQLNFEQPGTARLRQLLKNHHSSGGRVLVVTGENAPHIYRSSLNLSKVEVKGAHSLNTEDILRAHAILMEESAVGIFDQSLKMPPAAVEAEPAAETEDVHE